MEPIGIFGAGGHGKVVADVAASAGFRVVGFLDDARSGFVQGCPVLPLDAFVREFPGVGVALGIGDNAARMATRDRLVALGIPVVTLVHLSAIVSPSAVLDEGVVVMPRAVVNACARVGAGTIVNTGAVVEHDCVVGPFVHVAPGAALAGGVRIGGLSHIGLGAVVIERRTVGDGSVVGAGAVVVRSVGDRVTVVGVPARPIGRPSAGSDHASRRLASLFGRTVRFRLAN